MAPKLDKSIESKGEGSTKSKGEGSTKSKGKGEGDCWICGETYSTTQPPAKLKWCNHQFCRSCVNKCEGATLICPLCPALPPIEQELKQKILALASAQNREREETGGG